MFLVIGYEKAVSISRITEEKLEEYSVRMLTNNFDKYGYIKSIRKFDAHDEAIKYAIELVDSWGKKNEQQSL